MSRVVFYSKEDGASDRNLEDAKILLTGLNVNDEFQINALLEFRNVQLYFENGMFPSTWDEQIIAQFKESIASIDPKIKKYFYSITDEIFNGELGSIEYNYREAYWSMLNNLKAYKNINPATFEETLIRNPHHIYHILSHKNIVDHFSGQIRNFLVQYEDSAEIILSAIEEAERFNKNDAILPKALTLADREDIISRYISGAEPNVNFINLIENSKDSPSLKLSDKVRLAAKKKALATNESILSGESSGKFGIAVSFDRDQIERKKSKIDGLNTELSYSRNYLDGIESNVELFRCFVDLFEYLDVQHLITLVAKESEKNVFERIQMMSKNAYPGGFAFRYKVNTGLIQMRIFDAYMKHRGRSVEKLIISYVNERLHKKKGLDNFSFTLPDDNASLLSKIRLLAPELESLLKQFQCFKDEGKIDFELLQINTSQLNFSEIGSTAKIKYIYQKENNLTRLKNIFFSDQTGLAYVKPFENEYHNLYDLLVNEEVNIENFEIYQRRTVDELINDEFFEVDTNNFVRIAKPLHVFIIGLIHRDGVLKYWRCEQQLKDVIDEMIESDYLEASSKLFTRQEVSFYNFFLNQKEFTDGYNIRNKYLHGTNQQNADQQQFDYYMLLILIVLALLKIDDDLVCGLLARKEQ